VDRRSPRPGEVRHSGASLDRTRRILGYEPAVRFEDGLAETVAWCRAWVDADPGAASGAGTSAGPADAAVTPPVPDPPAGTAS